MQHQIRNLTLGNEQIASETNQSVPAEYQVEKLMIFVEFRRYVQDVLVTSKWHRKRVPVDDTVERKFIDLVRVSYRDNIAHLFDNVLSK